MVGILQMKFYCGGFDQIVTTMYLQNYFQTSNLKCLTSEKMSVTDLLKYYYKIMIYQFWPFMENNNLPTQDQF
jgi:hypothetical protein